MELNATMLKDFFMYCSVINIALLIITFIFFRLTKNKIYAMHSKWFQLTKEQFDSLWYGILGLYKILIFVFNIVPFIVMLIIA